MLLKQGQHSNQLLTLPAGRQNLSLDILSSVILALKQVNIVLPPQPTQEVSKEFMLSSQPLFVEANLDKGVSGVCVWHGCLMQR